ncbi:biopolymer transporter ExbD [Thioalkalivibrio versutus]|uniref:Biopolymer transporter ExbD n=1 Tax=Thioalkalivibrio versutus TaxID=106634 RepID=A0A0G3G6I0_9GAMM|nr:MULTISPECIES: biopolymer transporter ExbD [Thioalkalivibrio]AKJ95979.1 biopolymer transporter ExbD [Thioalkalivibrio versutus]
MAFGRMGDTSEPMSDMNVIPLVDVMLVLLVIFIITAPVITHSVDLDLPQATSEPVDELPDSVTLSLDGSGDLYWNNESVSLGRLPARLREALETQPDIVIYLRADRDTRYERLARVMAEVRQSGVSRMAFVSEPEGEQ